MAKQITFRADDTQVEKIQEVCRKTGCDASTVVRRALDQFLTVDLSECAVLTARGQEALLRPAPVPAPRPFRPNVELISQPSSAAAPAGRASDGFPAAQPAPGSYTYPAALGELLPRYRHLGMDLRRERRRMFQGVLAASEVLREHGGEERDEVLCRELLRLGQSNGFM